jgi:mono/diheme cytochrome c family protein
MQTRLVLGVALLGMGLIVAPGYGHAQGVDLGKQEYMFGCADCHGVDGKGNGPVAEYMKPKVPDLTVLAKNYAGVFPFARVYDVIDGRQVVGAHGPRNMLIWGNEFGREGEYRSGGNATSEEVNSYVRGKIIALIGYIYTLQTK